MDFNGLFSYLTRNTNNIKSLTFQTTHSLQDPELLTDFGYGKSFCFNSLKNRTNKNKQPKSWSVAPSPAAAILWD